MRPPEPEMPSSRPDAGRLSGAQVMVIDDNAANVLVLKRLLELAGIGKVHGFTDPRAALERCFRSPPDALLLDLRMPDLDGIAVLRALRSDRRGGVSVPVLVLTADDDTEIMRSALDAGAEDFLAKPFDLNEVLFRVRKLLESGQRTGPQ